MSLKIYGYAGCSTVKKAVSWANEKGLAPDYKHFNKAEDLESNLVQWVAIAGIERVFNAKAQTFRKLDEEQQALIIKDEKSMIAAMIADPRFIKRPVGTDGKTVLTGFDVAEWEKSFT